MECVRYEGRVVVQAIIDTMHFLRRYAMSLSAALLTGLLAVGFTLWRHDQPAIVLLSAPSAWLGIVFLVLLGNLFLAPFRMHKKDEASHRTAMQAQVEHSQRDAVEHVVVSGRSAHDIAFHGANEGAPMMYPVVVRNTRPYPMDIVGYDVTIYCNDSPFGQQIVWQMPRTRANNGLGIFHSLTDAGLIAIPADSCIQLLIPVDIRSLGNSLNSPTWGAKGQATVRCGQAEHSIPFDLRFDRFQFTPEKWNEVRSRVTSINQISN